MHLVLEAYARDDPLGAPLGVVTKAYGKQALCEPNALGSLAFTINRHDSQQSWVPTGAYVLAYLGATPTDVSGDAFAGYFLADADDTLLHGEEQVAHEYKRQGRGSIVYVEEASIWHTIAGSASYTVDLQGGNVVWLGTTMGQVLADLLDEAQARGCIPGLTTDFSGSVDSNGDAWEDSLDKYQLPIGLDLLSVVNKMRSAGYIVTMSPSMVLSVYQDLDLGSSGVAIVAGDNISTEAGRQGHDRARSSALVQGATQAGELKYREVDNGTYLTELGRRKETFVKYGATPTNSALQRAGTAVLGQQHKRYGGIEDIGQLITTGKVPFADYVPYQTVAVTIPGLYTASEKPVVSITIVETDGGEADAIIGFEATPYDPLDGLPSAEPTNTDTGGSPCGDCPPQHPFVPEPGSDATVGNGACAAHTSGVGFEGYVSAGFASGQEPDEGVLVIFVAAIREGTTIAIESGWTVIANTGTSVSGGETAFRLVMAAIYADPDNPSAAQPAPGNFRLTTANSNISFRAGVLAVPSGDIDELVATVYGPANTTARAMSVAATGQGVVVTGYAIDWVNTLTDGAGFTTFCAGLGSNGANIAPKLTAASEQVSGAGTITNTVAIGEGGAYGGGAIVFIPGHPTTPNPGQPIPPETHSVGDGVVVGSGISTVTLDHCYWPGSLEVTVDNIDVLAAHIVEDNPDTGTYHLSWAIDSDETVVTKYQRCDD